MTIAVLGLGSIGLRHARNAISLGCKVIAFDPRAERRRLLTEEGGTAARDRKEALSRAEIAVIASPSECHLADLRAAIDADCHVMIEKPLAHTVEGLEEILRDADARARIVFVAQNLRFHPVVRAARRALDENLIGKLLWARSIASSYLPDWRPTQDYRSGYAAQPETGGALFDFIHEFDMLAYLIGSFDPLSVVTGRSGTLQIHSEDCVNALLRHVGGIVSNIHVDYVTRPAIRVTEIAGWQGFLRLDILARQFEHLDVSGEVVTNIAFDDQHPDDYVTEMQAYLNCIATGSPPLCDGWQALEILKSVVKARSMAGLPAAPASSSAP